MSLDLSGVRTMLETQFMDDVLTVTSGPAGDALADLDQTTLVLTPAAETEVWSGNGAVVPRGTPRAMPIADDMQFPLPPDADYVALVSLSAPPFEVDQIVTVTGTTLPQPRDPQIQGERFRIRSIPDVATFAVVRVLALKRLPRSAP